jgi:hypothetical protein
MFVLFGFAVGYVLGARAGQEGLDRLITSWQIISRSDEFQAAVESAKEVFTSGLGQILSEGAGAVGGEVREVLDRRLHRAA